MLFDETASSCPIDAEPAFSMRKMQFFCCGCVVCSDCLEEGDNSCPVHEGSQLFRADKATADYVRQIERLAREYERNYNASRDALDEAVLQARRHVWRVNGGREECVDSQTSQNLPLQTNSQGYYANSYYQAAENLHPASQPSIAQSTCPLCHRPLTSMRCPCGYFDLNQVKTVQEETTTCQQCGGQVPAGTACTKCQSMQQVPFVSKDVWTCAHCKYEYNLRSILECSKCHVLRVSPSETWSCKTCSRTNSQSSSRCSYCSAARVPQPVQTHPAQIQPAQVKPAHTHPAQTHPAQTHPVQAKPVQPAQTHPAQTPPAYQVWTCAQCNYEYNFIVDPTCQKCRAPKNAPVSLPANTSQGAHRVRAEAQVKESPALSPKKHSAPEGGSWVCTYCLATNRSESAKCSSCYRSRSGLASPPAPQSRGRPIVTTRCIKCFGKGCSNCKT